MSDDMSDQPMSPKQLPSRSARSRAHHAVASALPRGTVARGILAIAALAAVGGIVGSVAARGGTGQKKVPTTAADFFQPGTQPEPNPDVFAPINGAINCQYCHSDYGDQVAPYDTWITSLMGQSARDPVWHAALAIANQDANVGGETCIRCH